jgi:malate permease and related proteins
MFPALFQVFVLLLAGYVARRLGRFPDNAPEVLNRFIIDICLPATILRLVPTLTLHVGLAALVVTPWVMAAVAYLAARVAGRWLGLSDATRTVLFLTTALGNTSFLGFPLCSALLGERAVPLAAVYDQLGSFLMLSVLLPLALGRVATGTSPSARELARRVFTFPPFVALVVAVLPIARPSFVEPLLSAAAAALVPLAMVSVGMKLRLTPPRPARVLAVGLVLKLGVLPGVAWALLRLCQVPAFVLQVAVLETAMPTMITAGALIMAAGIGAELAAAFVGWGLVLSLVTVPLWAYFLR